MELKVNDIYRIEANDFISSDLCSSLFVLYQPLIGKDATTVYMTLYSLGLSQKNQENHNRILAILNMDIVEFERARIKLEEYLLLRVYAQTQDAKTSYIYSLNAPLSVHSFFQQKELVSILVNAIGAKNVELIMNRFLSNDISTNGYENITRAISHTKKARDFDTSIEFSKPEKRYNFNQNETDIHFDYDRFLNITSPLVFPAELRTQENMLLIGQLATLYGLTPDRMNIIVKDSVNIDKMVFFENKLKLLSQKSQPDEKDKKDPYQLSPVSFLQSKQNGAAVSLSDRKLLEYLSLKMNFPTEVINVLIEYVLSISQNRLIKSFVESVAGEWARDGVDTREKAFEATKKKLGTPRQTSKKQMPSYYKKLNEQKDEKPTEDQLGQLEEMMKKMGK